MTTPTYLEKKNPHERDSHITFEEKAHKYTIDGENDFLSVTTWNHAHFEKFNADKIIDKMMSGKNWTKSKYYGQTKEEIKKLWNDNGRLSAEQGTQMHYDIECFYNKMEVENDSIEYQYFQNFYNDHKQMTPYRTEWMIWDKDHKLAGSIDMIFENEDETLSIYDWKRSKEIKKQNRWQHAKTECIAHLPDCNYMHYCLQLNTYKKIIETKYGKKVKDMYLVCLHPNNSNKNYQKIKVLNMGIEMDNLFDERKKQLKNPFAAFK